MKYGYFIVSIIALLLLIILSNEFSFGTTNTAWGMICFIIFSTINLIGSAVNASKLKKEGSGKRFIFYFLSFIFCTWIVASFIVIIVFRLPMF